LWGTGSGALFGVLSARRADGIARVGLSQRRTDLEIGSGSSTGGSSLGRVLPQPLRKILSELDPLLRRKRRASVAILEGEGSAIIEDLIRQCYPRTKITAVPARYDDSALHVSLAANGPHDAIIDTALDRQNPVQLYRDIFSIWEAAKARHPDLKVLLGKRPGAAGVQPFERAILVSRATLEAVGVSSNDIKLIDGSMRVERLLAATPMFSMPEYISPGVVPTWNMVGRTVGAQADGRALPKRFFCGRNKKTRFCHNSRAVEQMFAESAWKLYIRRISRSAARLPYFQQADVVAGYVGSALFTLCFCAKPKRVIMISPESYSANNEYLIAGVRGHEMDVFWSESDGRGQNTHFRFDFEREGRRLQEVLSNLP